MNEGMGDRRNKLVVSYKQFCTKRLFSAMESLRKYG